MSEHQTPPEQADETPHAELSRILQHAGDTAGYTKAYIEGLEDSDFAGGLKEILRGGISFEYEPPPEPTEEEISAAAVGEADEMTNLMGVPSYRARYKEWKEAQKAVQEKAAAHRLATIEKMVKKVNDFSRLTQHQGLARLNLEKAQLEFTINIFNLFSVMCLGGELPNPDPRQPNLIVRHGLFAVLDALGGATGAGGGLVVPGPRQ
jgi:hypothetical protein